MANTTSVTAVRNFLRNVARTRKTRTVTADDVHTFLKGKRMSTAARLSLINAAFAASEFKAIGETASRREAARYRKINEYRVTR